jgi:hypothetical protein
MPKLKGQMNAKIQMPEANSPIWRILLQYIWIFFGYLSLGFDLTFGF